MRAFCISPSSEAHDHQSSGLQRASAALLTGPPSADDLSCASRIVVSVLLDAAAAAAEEIFFEPSEMPSLVENLEAPRQTRQEDRYVLCLLLLQFIQSTFSNSAFVRIQRMCNHPPYIVKEWSHRRVRVSAHSCHSLLFNLCIPQILLSHTKVLAQSPASRLPHSFRTTVLQSRGN